MPCLLCKKEETEYYRLAGQPLCVRCRNLEGEFARLVVENRDAAYNWAMQKALDLAGDITGIEPGSSYLKVEDGELTIETVEKVKTTVARYVPPELKK